MEGRNVAKDGGKSRSVITQAQVQTRMPHERTIQQNSTCSRQTKAASPCCFRTWTPNKVSRLSLSFSLSLSLSLSGKGTCYPQHQQPP